MSDPVIELRDVAKTYRKGGEIIEALAGIDLTVPGPGMVAVVGPSGSGKSTLLHIVGAWIDSPAARPLSWVGRWAACRARS